MDEFKENDIVEHTSRIYDFLDHKSIDIVEEEEEEPPPFFENYYTYLEQQGQTDLNDNEKIPIIFFFKQFHHIKFNLHLQEEIQNVMIMDFLPIVLQRKIDIDTMFTFIMDIVQLKETNKILNKEFQQLDNILFLDLLLAKERDNQIHYSFILFKQFLNMDNRAVLLLYPYMYKISNFEMVIEYINQIGSNPLFKNNVKRLLINYKDKILEKITKINEQSYDTQRKLINIISIIPISNVFSIQQIMVIYEYLKELVQHLDLSSLTDDYCIGHEITSDNEIFDYDFDSDEEFGNCLEVMKLDETPLSQKDDEEDFEDDYEEDFEEDFEEDCEEGCEEDCEIYDPIMNQHLENIISILIQCSIMNLSISPSEISTIICKCFQKEDPDIEEK